VGRKARAERECPVCGTKHRKRGQYCSKPCSNSGRTVTEAQKQKTSKSMERFMNSDSDVAEEARWRINNYDKEEPVVPPYQPEERYYRDGEDIWFDAD